MVKIQRKPAKGIPLPKTSLIDPAGPLNAISDDGKYTLIQCARCRKKRRSYSFFTSSGAHTKVCESCRKIHKDGVILAKVSSTTLSAQSLSDKIVCEKCGKSLPIKEMMKHRDSCMKTRFADLPGLAPEGELAEQ